MFNVDGKEFIFLVLIALVVLGPEKLPDLFRRAGRLYSEVKRMSDGFQAEFQRAIEEPMKQVNETRDLVRESVDFRLSDDPNTNGSGSEGTDDAESAGGAQSADVPQDQAEASPDALLPAEVYRDQAEVERRIAEMEQANATNYGGGGQTASTDPASHRPAANTPQRNGTDPESTEEGRG